MTDELKCPTCIVEEGGSDAYDRESLGEHHLEGHGIGLSDEKLDEIEETGGELNGVLEELIELKQEDLDVGPVDAAREIEGLTAAAAHTLLDDLTHGDIEGPEEETNGTDLDELLDDEEDTNEDDVQTAYHLTELDEGGTYHLDRDCGYVSRPDGNPPEKTPVSELKDRDDWSACSSCGEGAAHTDIKKLRQEGPCNIRSIPDAGSAAREKVRKFDPATSNSTGGSSDSMGGQTQAVYYIPDEHDAEEILRAYLDENPRLVEAKTPRGLNAILKGAGEEFDEVATEVVRDYYTEEEWDDSFSNNPDGVNDDEGDEDTEEEKVRCVNHVFSNPDMSVAIADVDAEFDADVRLDVDDLRKALDKLPDDQDDIVLRASTGIPLLLTDDDEKTIGIAVAPYL